MITPDQLLLTAERQTQLTQALSNAGIANPLPVLIAEAEARLDLELAGLTIPEELRVALVRALTLHEAYALVGPVPKDIAQLYQQAREQLAAITRRADPILSDDPRAGLRGGDSPIGLRS